MAPDAAEVFPLQRLAAVIKHAVASAFSGRLLESTQMLNTRLSNRVA